MSDVSFVVQDVADEQARAVVGQGLHRFNESQVGVFDNTPLDVLIRDETTGDVVGGLVGRTSLGLLFVDYFHVPESLRGRGHGAHALALAESEASRRGCAMAVLFTMAVQAPGFYEKCGYEEFGRVASTPPGNARIFMRKELVPITAAD